ncbi:MAG: PIN domain-containing protein [Opitutaceae bacterium]|nr:PIN domain-containing protein [Opitutaceae bacterium]
MKTVFADANYWIALINPRDDLHALAMAATAQGGLQLVTTDWVLVEVLNFFADKGAAVRVTAARTCDSIRNSPNVEVVPALRSDLEAATGLYRQHADKEWSAVDCHSLKIMRERQLTEVFTHDHHFEQMGFKALLR